MPGYWSDLYWPLGPVSGDTLRAQVLGRLEADGTLGAILTGGIYDRREISRTLTPGAYDTDGTLKPCAVLTIGTQEAFEPHPDYGFERDWFQVWFYEEAGNHYAAVDVARDRVRALLNTQRVTTTLGTVWEMRFADAGPDWFDDALGAEASFDRYFAWRKR